MWFVLAGLAVAAILFVVTSGHVIFLPLFLVLPLGGFFSFRRSRRQ